MSSTDRCRGGTDIQLPTPPTAAFVRPVARRQVPARRPFLPQPLTLGELSALLWAAFGPNRRGSWGRTAPPPEGSDGLVVYALSATGAYRYDPAAHRLLLVTPEDLRNCSAPGDATLAPLELLFVLEPECSGHDVEEEHGLPPPIDPAAVAQNVQAYCADAGLVAGVREPVDAARLAQALRLRARQEVALAQCVGRPRRITH